MDITVVIVCSTDIMISKCLQSIPNGISILVVLNNPNKCVLDIVSHDTRVKTIRSDVANLGYLRQMAAEHVTTKGIVYVDSDCVIEPGTIEIVVSELDNFSVVSIPMRYVRENFFTSIVSRCREFTTPDEALFIPAGFRLDIQKKIGGYLFDRRLAWGEDTDQKRRLDKNNISVEISKGLVWHRALGIREDARSAMRLGRGRRIRELAGLSPQRNILRDLSLIFEFRKTWRCFKETGFLSAVYHFFVWRTCYKVGYWKERCN